MVGGAAVEVVVTAVVVVSDAGGLVVVATVVEDASVVDVATGWSCAALAALSLLEPATQDDHTSKSARPNTFRIAIVP